MDVVIRMLDLDSRRIRVGVIPGDYPEWYCRTRELTILYVVDKAILTAIVETGGPVLIETDMGELLKAVQDEINSAPIYAKMYRRLQEAIKCCAADIEPYFEKHTPFDIKRRQCNPDKY